MKLIDKDAVLAEIDKRLHQLTDAAFDSMIGRNLIEIKDFLDTLEVKEVDLESEMDKFYGMYRKNGITYDKSDNEVCFDWKDAELSKNEICLAKHFFELGIKAQKGE